MSLKTLSNKGLVTAGRTLQHIGNAQPVPDLHHGMLHAVQASAYI